MIKVKSIEFWQMKPIDGQGFLHILLEIAIAVAEDSAKPFDIAQDYLNAELDVGEGLQAEEDDLACVVEHEQIKIDHTQELKLSFRHDLLDFLKVVGQQAEASLRRRPYSVCYLYQEDIFVRYLHEEDGYFCGEEEEFFPEDSLTDLNGQQITVYWTDLK